LFFCKNYLATSIGINNVQTTNDDFFSTFLNNQKQPSSEIEIKVENEPSISAWNSWGDNNNPSQIVRKFIFVLFSVGFFYKT
jgi:hypothetical protein